MEGPDLGQIMRQHSLAEDIVSDALNGADVLLATVAGVHQVIANSKQSNMTPFADPVLHSALPGFSLQLGFPFQHPADASERIIKQAADAANPEPPRVHLFDFGKSRATSSSLCFSSGFIPCISVTISMTRQSSPRMRTSSSSSACSVGRTPSNCRSLVIGSPRNLLSFSRVEVSGRTPLRTLVMVCGETPISCANHLRVWPDSLSRSETNSASAMLIGFAPGRRSQ